MLQIWRLNITSQIFLISDNLRFFCDFFKKKMISKNLNFQTYGEVL